MSSSVQKQALLVALVNSTQRHEAAQALAKHLSADNLIIFVVDPEIGVLLPASGFPQTLPSGRSWRAFLTECSKQGQYTAEVAYPNTETKTVATALAAQDGSVLVLLGGAPRLNEAAEVCLLLPLLAAAFQGEVATLVAASHADVARASAAQARALAETLNKTRLELERALRAAEEANQSKDEFLSMLSHELRTPLNSIIGWTHILLKGKLDEEMVAQAIKTIERNAKSQAKLIEDMLDLSRIILGKLRLDMQPVDLTAVINAAIDTARPATEAKDIRLQVVMDSSTGPVFGDPERLQQVTWNLLANAVKFTPKGGRIQVQLQRINSHLEITVSDSGPGIEAELIPYIFDRFRQADSGTTRKHGGLGLGLAIVRHLVELHGGTVDAGNSDEGLGAVFTVKIPLMIVRRPTGHLATEAERVHPAVGGGVPFDGPTMLAGIKVLVVDDEPDARQLLELLLLHQEAEVRTCGSSAEALRALEEFKPDVLVSDIGMPEEDGYRLIERVRTLKPEHGGRTPAVALTAYARVEDRLRALSAGYDMHVAKPVEPAELAITIASLFSRNKNV